MRPIHRYGWHCRIGLIRTARNEFPASAYTTVPLVSGTPIKIKITDRRRFSSEIFSPGRRGIGLITALVASSVQSPSILKYTGFSSIQDCSNMPYSSGEAHNKLCVQQSQFRDTENWHDVSFTVTSVSQCCRLQRLRETYQSVPILI